MGVAQLTLSCDRSFITNLCFIRLFSNSSIWRAHRVQVPRMRGFPFLTRRACAESNPRSDRPSPPRSSIPTKRAVVPAVEPRFGLAAPIGCQNIGCVSIIKAGCAPSGSVSDPDRGSGLHARPIGDRRSGPTSPVPGFRCLASARAVQIAGNSVDWNLPLAARPCVGHIGLTELWPSG